jgi:protein TonB
MMISDRLFIAPDLPEWRRSGQFFVAAIALHAAVLFYPLQLAISQLDVPTPSAIAVSLVQAVTAAPEPAKAQPAAASPTPTPAPVQKKTLARPVMAVTPEQSTTPSSFTAPPPAAAPAQSVSTASASNTSPAPLSAPRFDAAYLDNPRPNYPPLSRRLNEEGKVLLKVKVSPDGLPATVHLEKSSNFERLDEAARQAVARWRFIPAKRGDEAVEASVIVPIVFRLDS